MFLIHSCQSFNRLTYFLVDNSHDPEGLLGILDELLTLINEHAENPNDNSYSELLDSGIKRCAQKVGEEAIETVMATVNADRDELISEAGSLIYHLLVLLKATEINFYEVLRSLQERKNAIHV